jgi:riboflavin kinase/FMN adenylyltransferase
LLDFAGDLYGEDAAVTFLAFLRSEKQFAGIDELKTQLKLDVEHARVAVQNYKRQ